MKAKVRCHAVGGYPLAATSFSPLPCENEATRAAETAYGLVPLCRFHAAEAAGGSVRLTRHHWETCGVSSVRRISREDRNLFVAMEVVES